MDKTFRLILIGIIALLVINGIFSLFQNSNINEALRGVKRAEKLSDSVLMHLQESQDKLNIVLKELDESKSYIQALKVKAEISELEKKTKDKVTNKKLDSLDEERKKLEAEQEKFKSDSTIGFKVKK
ncbi:hypothetical protein GS399_05805 [Pedobacter sp. HMF7647]|uniref:Uncharacterized protein n=1 Tax=Hufsiella arboris TaxID=2695275 RepID=A0A7K1Y7Y9_9SPHI|nr:hypothetical protein [Hufsiella arboris]MXV50481.1 hypothetical protein [Hufsiella arboris]